MDRRKDNSYCMYACSIQYSVARKKNQSIMVALEKVAIFLFWFEFDEIKCRPIIFKMKDLDFTVIYFEM